MLRAVEEASTEGITPTLAALAERTGSHPNTLRDHLDALLHDGAIRRRRTEPTGRGRPAWRYEVVRDDGFAEYAGLATTLAAAIHHASTDPVAASVAAGTEWGHELARPDRSPDRPPGPAPTAASDQVVDLFTRLGFAPRVDTTTEQELTVRLTRCPLLEAARRYPDVVCGVHRGIAEGALAEYGADNPTARLLPFAEPGACVLHLAGPAPTP